MRLLVPAIGAVLSTGTLMMSPSASAAPTVCDVPACIPGIQPGAVLGAPCTNTSYYAFGVTAEGRMLYCLSPRREPPRWFRTLAVRGIKELTQDCSGFENEVAQAPDGLFLTCVTAGGDSRWLRGDS